MVEDEGRIFDEEDLPATAKSALAVEEYTGKVPLHDFNRKWSRFTREVWLDLRRAVQLSYEAQSLGTVLMESQGGDVTRMNELFRECRYYLIHGRRSTCRIPIQSLKQLFEESGIALAPII